MISAVPGLTVLSKCFNLDGSNPTYANTNPYCQLMQRDPPPGQILTVATPYLNLGGIKDGWARVPGALGRALRPFLGASAKLYVDTAIELLDAYKVQLLPGAPFVNYTGISVGGALPGSVPPRAAPKIEDAYDVRIQDRHLRCGPSLALSELYGRRQRGSYSQDGRGGGAVVSALGLVCLRRSRQAHRAARRREQPL